MSQNNNMNNKRIKSQSQYKRSPPSPSASPTFKPKEIVLYHGIEAEINRIRQNGLIEITYPTNEYIMRRNKATVNSQQIDKKKAGHQYSHQHGHQHQKSPKLQQSKPSNDSIMTNGNNNNN
eukprot:278194_1